MSTHTEKIEATNEAMKSALKTNQALHNRVFSLETALQQAVDQLENDYDKTPLDGRRALIDKLTAVLGKPRSM